jgi:hypothetical protein
MKQQWQKSRRRFYVGYMKTRAKRGVVGRPAAGVVDLPDRRHLAVRLADPATYIKGYIATKWMTEAPKPRPVRKS